MTTPLAKTLMIDDNAELARWCQHWQSLPFVAVDTEFVRAETFYPIAGLIQVGDGEQAVLIDPLAITDWAPLVALLEAPSVVKVLHACSEDLEVFSRLCGALPSPLFDTQLAAAFLGMDFSMGYSRLVSELLQIDLPKDETRSDWLQRPLSAAQVEYAARDAQHLAELYRIMAPRLEAAGLTDWLLADTAEQVSAISAAIRCNCMELIRDMNGNHVVQRCLACMAREQARATAASLPRLPPHQPLPSPLPPLPSSIRAREPRRTHRRRASSTRPRPPTALPSPHTATAAA